MGGSAIGLEDYRVEGHTLYTQEPYGNSYKITNIMHYGNSYKITKAGLQCPNPKDVVYFYLLNLFFPWLILWIHSIR